MKYAFLFLLLLIIFFPIYIINAEPPLPEDSKGGSQSGTVTLNNPLGTKEQPNPTPQVFIGRIINAILGLVGSLALLMFIYGGFNWMTAAGNAEKVEKGKSILIWATIGLIVIFTSYALVRFVLFNVVGAPQG